MHFTPYLLLVSCALAAPLIVNREDDCTKTTASLTAARFTNTFSLMPVPTPLPEAKTTKKTATSHSPKLAVGSPVVALEKTTKATKYPFTRMVAFGDNLSDNGNGSIAHGEASPGHSINTIYGFGTWTNGPVAVSYLSDLIDAPLVRDYAYGHKSGGSLFGATIDNAYTQSTADAPSSKDQIANYTNSPGYKNSIAETLHFLWIGANDINLHHIDTSKSYNPQFASDFSTKLAAQVKSLLDVGAPYIVVPNLYAKNLSLSSEFYANTPQGVANLGAAITEANAAIKTALEPFGKKVIYYDVFSYMVDVYKNASKYGFDYLTPHGCDVGNAADWKLFSVEHKGNEFYWMHYLDMTTHVHQLIAQDMAKTIEAHFSD